MGEQRIKAYWNLIQQLFSCNKGKESEILQENSSLIDEDLVNMEVMRVYNDRQFEESIAIGVAAQLAEIARWKQLNQEVRRLNNEAKFGEGIAIGEQALTLARELWGDKHPNVASSLNNLAELYRALNRYQEAEPLYKEAIAIDHHSLPPVHSQLATHLNNLALLYKSLNRYQEAEDLYKEAIAIARHSLPPLDPQLATHLNNLALLYRALNRYQEVEPLYKEAIAIDRQSLPPLDPSLATHLNNLANLYRTLNRYKEAEDLYKEAIAIDRHSLPPLDPQLASHLNNLAELCRTLNRYQEAEDLYKEAIAIDRQSLSPLHPSLATHLNNLANLYRTLNRYKEAEDLYKEAIAIVRQSLPPLDPQLATHLNNLALLYRALNRYQEAEPLYKEAIAIDRQSLPPLDPSLATDLSNLAGLYESLNRYQEAKDLYLEAIAIDRQSLPPLHPQLATHLNGLAKLYQALNRYQEAKDLYLEAIAIDRQSLPPLHPSLATHLNNLANLYQALNPYQEAEDLYLEAIAIVRQSLPLQHSALATHLNNLAGLYGATDRPVLAFKLMRQASKIEDSVIRNIFASSSDSDRLAYLKTIRGNFQAFISLVYSYLSHSRSAKKAALNLTLKRKALTASALAAFNQAIYGDLYPHLKNKFQQWRDKCDQLLNLTYSQPQLGEKDAYQAALTKLQGECNQLERELAREVPEIQLQEQIGDRRAVALELPEGSTLIEFIRFDVYDFKAVKAKGESEWKPARYLAFTLAAGQPSQVEMIDLGEAESIDRLIHIFRQSVSDSSFPSQLEMFDEEPETQSVSVNQFSINQLEDLAIGIELRKAIFDPIRAAIGSSRHLIIAPDGNLNVVPFNVLPYDEGETRLMDNFAISYLTVGRDVLRRKIEVKRQPGKPLIIADPQFDLTTSLSADIETLTSRPAGVKTPASKFKSSEEDSKKEQSVSTDFSYQTGNLFPGELLSQLSDTSFLRAESTGYLATAVAATLGVKPYLRNEAITTHLTSAKSPTILLVATHGFWLEKQDEYVKIVRQLLACKNGKEGEILARNSYLLDENLLKTMQRGVTELEQNGLKNLANWLQNFATQLKEVMDTNSPETPLFSSPSSPATRHRFSTQAENPMMRSGLAFTGAKNWLSGQSLPEKAGKGIVFAQDIAGVDLWGTELALLIACQSGLGDVEAGEGVFGLRRAFFVAGAKTLIMSLWSVPEKASILLMNRLFNNLKKGLGRGEALQDAQTYIRTITIRELLQSSLGVDVLKELFPNNSLSPEVIASQGDFKPLKHPYFWGAWVCQGETTGFKLE
jgi:tetratricopeptide (TPR) repeat protein